MGRVPDQGEIIAAYGKVLLKDPRSRVFVSMASVCLRTGKPRLALDVLEKGLKHHPRMNSALTLKGRVLLTMGRAAEAEELLRRVAQDDPENLLAVRLLARAGTKAANAEPAGTAEAERTATETGAPEVPHDEAVETLERWLNNAARMVKG